MSTPEPCKVADLNLRRLVAGKADPKSKPFAPGAVECHRSRFVRVRRIALAVTVIGLVGAAFSLIF